MPAKTYVLTEILDYVGTHVSSEGPFGISQRELAQALGYHSCSMSRPLDRLVHEGLLHEGRGLVRGGIRKQLTYHLTPQGKERLHRQTRFVPMLPSELPVPPRPFVGRRDELRQLSEYGRDPEALIWVHGGPGMGKTALVAQLVRGLKRGRVPFWFTVRPGSSPRHFLAAVAHALTPVGAAQLAYYAESPRNPTGREVASLLLRALGDHALLGVIDDIQSAGNDMRTFLTEFLPPAAGEGKALFIVVGQEGPFLPAGTIPIHRLEVGGLDRISAHELTDRQGGLADRFEAVFQASLGSPLILQLAVQTPGVEATLATLPDAVVGRMPIRDVVALLPAALANEPLPIAFLTEMSGLPEPRIEELTRLGVLHPAHEGRVELLEAIRRALISRAGPAEAEAHRLLAAFYGRSHRPEAVRERFIHLVAGEDWRGASEVLSKEDRKLLELGYSDALRNALGHLTLGLPAGTSRIRALRLEAELLRAHSGYTDAILLLRRAIDDAGDDRRISAECLLQIVELFLRLRQIDQAEATLDEARRMGASTRRLRLFFQLTEARLVEARGNLGTARELFRSTFDESRRARISDLAVESLAAWSRVTVVGGYEEEALRIVEEGLPGARAAGRTDLVFTLLLVRARAYQETGKRDLAELEMRKLRAETEALGYLTQLTYTLSGLAAMTVEAGRWNEATEFARQASTLAQRLGNETVFGHTLAVLSAGEIRQGQLESARDHGEQSVRVLSRLPASDSLVLAHSYLAEAYVALGQGEPARTHYGEAITLARSMGMLPWIQQLESELKKKIDDLLGEGSGSSASTPHVEVSQAESEGGV